MRTIRSSSQPFALSVLLCLAPACSEQGITELGVFRAEQEQTETPSLPDARVRDPSSPDDNNPALGDSGIPGACGEEGPGLATDAGQTSPEGEPVDPSLVCHRLTAHAAGQSTPYVVPGHTNTYVRFTFVAPWKGKTHIRSFKPLIDQRKVLHHWTLYPDTRALPESVQTVPSPRESGPLVFGWVPGTDALKLPSDIGMPVTDDVSYTLEAYYYNPDGDETLDASGIEVCVKPDALLFELSLSQPAPI